MIVLVLQRPLGKRQGAAKLLQPLRQSLFKLYQHLDRYVFRSSPDALAPVALRDALPGCRVVDGAALPTGSWASALRDEQVDVVMDPDSLLPEGALAELSTYGVWSTPLGRLCDPRTQSTPAFWEVIEGEPGIEARLCVRWKGCEEKVVVYTSVAPTDGRSLWRSRNHVYWKIAAALTRTIQRVWEDPGAFEKGLVVAAPVQAPGRPPPPPGNVATLGALARLLRRYIADKRLNTVYHEQWALAFLLGKDHPSTTLRTLVPPRDRSWADPFPLRHGGAYYIFHEEWPHSTGKGSIVVTRIDDDGSAAPPVPVLESDHHLSYPFVFSWDGELFMTPETASRHQVELYRCMSFPSEWRLEHVLLSGVRAFDPTVAFIFGKWWLFANLPAYGGGTWDELHAFYADSPLGPWIPHRNNPVKSDVRSARPAGRIFQRGEYFYRPAQDCSRRYGYAVSINRILRLDPETYEEVEVDKVIPNGSSHVVGVHTLNRAGDMTVIDCLIRTRRFSAPALRVGLAPRLVR